MIPLYLKKWFCLIGLCAFLASTMAAPLITPLTRNDQVQLFTQLFTHDITYAHDFAQRLNNIIALFHHLVGSDLAEQVHACLAFPFQKIEEPYNQTLNQIIKELIPLYYNPEGMLIAIVPEDTVARNFCIARLLKNDLDYNNYKRLLKIFKFHEVLEHEENTSTYLWNAVCDIAAGRWLPTLFEYPENIIERIQTHPANKILARIHTLCSQHNFANAYALAQEHSLPLGIAVCNDTYATYQQNYCNEYGVIKQYAHDPCFVALSEQEKQCLKQSIQRLEDYNIYLGQRFIRKEKLRTTWHIANTASTPVHTVLYQLIDCIHNQPLCVTECARLIKKHSIKEQQELKETFYTFNGIHICMQDLYQEYTAYIPRTFLNNKKIIIINTLLSLNMLVKNGLKAVRTQQLDSSIN